MTLDKRLSLVAERGGYQLYQFEAKDFDMLELPNADLDANDKIKLVARKLPRGKIPISYLWSQDGERVDYFLEDALPKCISNIILQLEKSSFGRDITVGLPTLREKVENLRSLTEGQADEARDRGEMAGGHDINEAKTYEGLVLGVDGNGLNDLPIYSLPGDIVQRRLRDNERYRFHIRSFLEACQVTNDGSINPCERTYKFFKDIKEGTADEEVIRRIVEKLPDFSEAQVRDGLEYSAFPLREEIRRHETVLEILDYMKSRLEK